MTGPERTLLAVDLGLKAGLALYGSDGRLLWYRSTHFGTMAKLKQGLRTVVSQAGPLAHLYAEGDRHHFELWAKEAQRVGAQVRHVAPEVWRPSLLLPRERRSGQDAKAFADDWAREIIAWSNAKAATSLRHDAAEAVLIGLYAVLEVGWLASLPPALAARRGR